MKLISLIPARLALESYEFCSSSVTSMQSSMSLSTCEAKTVIIYKTATMFLIDFNFHVLQLNVRVFGFRCLEPDLFDVEKAVSLSGSEVYQDFMRSAGFVGAVPTVLHSQAGDCGVPTDCLSRVASPPLPSHQPLFQACSTADDFTQVSGLS